MLHEQIRLLEEHIQQLTINKKSEYLGEIAGKLRLLVYERGNNIPLLLSLMDEFQIASKIKVEGNLDTIPIDVLPLTHPFPGDEITLREYLNMVAFWRDVHKKTIVYTHNDFIKIGSQQDGAAHIDSKLDEHFAFSKSTGKWMENITQHEGVFLRIAAKVISYANKFFAELKAQNKV